METALTYDDVLLLPQYSDIRSRSEVDISIDLGNGLNLDLPIFSSPMDTISETMMAEAMSNAGGSAILHRYNTIEEQVQMVREAKEREVSNIGFAIGIDGGYLDRAEECVKAGATFVCVDVAHGHHLKMREALKNLRYELGSEIHIMAGNVATLKGINDLADWGANSVRCNIGGGSICSTRIQTGHGHPGLQTIFDCARTHRDVTIIADGGIRNSGDIVKALAAGADAVMLGSLLAGSRETPGEVLTDGLGKKFKTYRGMASKEAQLDWRGRYSSFEGVSATVPYRGKVKNVLADLEKGIRSGLSYSGCRSIHELQHRAHFVRQTSAGLGESRTHITTRGML
jgi:IMP dehydrogenase